MNNDLKIGELIATYSSNFMFRVYKIDEFRIHVESVDNPSRKLWYAKGYPFVRIQQNATKDINLLKEI